MARKSVHHYFWTPEMIATLTELYGTCPAKEIAEILNAKFGTGFAPTAIWRMADRLQLKAADKKHRCTKEQIEWLRQNKTKYNREELVEEFNKVFNLRLGKYTLIRYCQENEVKGGKLNYKWTLEMDAALKELYGHRSNKEIAKILNDEFGTSFTKSAIENRIAVKQISTKAPGHCYTEEEEEWLCQNITKFTYKDLVVAFNQKFHTNQVYYALKCHCIRKGFKCGTALSK